MRIGRRIALAGYLIGMLGCAGCAREDRQIQQHQDALRSCAATVRAIARAWLDGRVSGTYANTALERTLLLVEQQRTALATRPYMLIDQRGAHLADSADQMERLVAAMMHAVRGAKADDVRSAVAKIPIGDQTAQP